MKSMLLVYNPVAGDTRIVSALSEIVNLFTAQGFLVTVYPTQAPGDARRMLADLNDGVYERVVVCGGDGMLHEALNGWMESKTSVLMGILPTGTVNDFAASHEIPRLLPEAAKVAAGDNWAAVDVGVFNDEYFTYVAAFGLATAVSYTTEQQRKNRFGSIAYVLQALRDVDFTHWENNCETMKISWEGSEASGDFLYGMVSNSAYVAGVDFFTRDLFDWADGLLEGVFIRRPMNLVELNQIINGIIHSDFHSPLFVKVQSPWFSFESEGTPWTLDGEYGGSHKTVHACVRPGALRLALPISHITHSRIDSTLSSLSEKKEAALLASVDDSAEEDGSSCREAKQ